MLHAMLTRFRACWILIAAGIVAGCSGNDQGDKKAPRGGFPGFVAARLDLDNVENMRAWAETAVARLKELEAKGNRAATDAEVAKLEKEMRDALQEKTIRWS